MTEPRWDPPDPAERFEAVPADRAAMNQARAAANEASGAGAIASHGAPIESEQAQPAPPPPPQPAPLQRPMSLPQPAPQGSGPTLPPVPAAPQPPWQGQPQSQGQPPWQGQPQWQGQPSWPAPQPGTALAGGSADSQAAWAGAAPQPGTGRASRVVPTGVFERAHARWLLLVSVVTMVGFMILFALVAAISRSEPSSEELLASALYVPLVGWVAYIAWRHKVRVRAFFRLPRIGWYWFVVLGMSVASFSFSIGASNITGALFPDYVSSAEVSTESAVWVLAFSLVVAPPFVEELIFRGVLLERWAVKWRLGVAIVVQGICFGILHVDPVGAGMFGVIMALMYLRCRSLWVPIAMHALNNGVVLVAVLTVPGAAEVPDQPQSLSEAILTGVIFMGVALPFLALFIYRNWPNAQTLTPYEVFEHGPDALPPRHVGPVRIASGPAGTEGQRGRLRLTAAGVSVTRDRKGRQVLTTAPYEAIRWVGVGPDYRGLDLRAADGTGVRLELPQRSVRIRTGIVRALGDRVRDRAGVEPAWIPVPTG